jgi:hypothetical protein
VKILLQVKTIFSIISYVISAASIVLLSHFRDEMDDSECLKVANLPTRNVYQILGTTDLFSLFDVLTIVFSILFLVLFLFLFQIERFRTKPRLYLKLGLLAIMFVLIVDDLLINNNNLSLMLTNIYIVVIGIKDFFNYYKS